MFDQITLRIACALEGVDTRSVLKRLRGQAVRGSAGARADRAIARMLSERSAQASPASAPRSAA